MDARLAPVLQDGLIDDPWSGGRPRLDAEAVVLPAELAARLARAACALAMMLDEAVPAVAASDRLIADLGMPPGLAALARLDAPRWLALARADVFATEDDAEPQVCEINCDTPTGLAECVSLGRVASAAGHADPSAGLARRWTAMVRQAWPGARPPVVGIVYPTEMTEDLCHVRTLARWLGEAGLRCVLGSPFNLHDAGSGRVGILGTPCDILVRHYKTDWWAERTPSWRDQPPPPDADPLAREIALVSAAQSAGTLAVVNPWGSAIAQNKRALALPWERPALFSGRTLDLVRRHLPETRFLGSVGPARLRAERPLWVLKSAYGCEGDEVLVGGLADDRAWAEAIDRAEPGQWVVQRAFRPRRDAHGRIANHGVFLVGGQPSGIYTRCSTGPTDQAALSCPTAVAP